MATVTPGKWTQPSTARPVPGTNLPTFVFDTPHALALHVAQRIASLVRERNAIGQRAVLGLATGSTPVGVYRELIRLHHEEGLDLSRVVTFNLDEYYGLGPDRLQSYHRWMRRNFFDHVNIPEENIHIPDGTVPPDEAAEHCRQYEAAIDRVGGIDIQILGIGRNGHIAFNEPFSEPNSRTRLVTLDPMTRRDAADYFFGEANVPTHAISMGIGTILKARKLLLLALGEHKADIIREAVEGETSDRVPASFLVNHPDRSVLLDTGSASQLTGIATPWVLGNVRWEEDLIKRAVLWLVEKTNKSLLKLDDCDFRDNNLHQLLREHGPAPSLAHRVFRWMMETIEYHPAGRDPKRVICFSPHPDDDVISMGGTLIRLVQDGHQVHIAYMTSGNIAVFDHDAARVADLVTEFNRMFDIDHEKSHEVERHVTETMEGKTPGEPDSETMLKIKGLIRWSEAKAGAKMCGCQEEHLHNLDLPFYRTGRIAKKGIGQEDITIIRELIERVAPHQIYVAGDLSDPHGTHRVCAEAIIAALREMEADGQTLPEVLLYRGAWEEWPAHEIEVAVPLSPGDVEQKKHAIFQHESQTNTAMFPGADEREFWQRAVERNRNTADLYNRIGLPEYYAMEGFVRYRGQPL